VNTGPQAAEPSPEPKVAEQPVGPVTAPAAAKRTWSMPKSPVTREQADRWGRAVLEAGVATGAFVGRMARRGAGIVGQGWSAIGEVPPAVRLLFVVAVLLPLGIIGTVALHNSLGLVCAIAVVPVCSATIGALGYRWSTGRGMERPRTVDDPASPQATISESQRSLEYVDKKLALALNAFGTERHQHAVIALFQAKTAVELTLGTEQDAANQVEALLPTEEHHLRPRIRAGSPSNSPFRESNSLAAS
jgi:hypothetical protein